MAATLVLGTTLAIAASALYAYVAIRVSRRSVSSESLLASKLFALWWNALAGITLVGALGSLLAIAGVQSLPAFLVLSNVGLLLLVVGLWALLFYLVFVFTGKRRVVVPLALFYAILYASFIGLQVWRQPVGVEVHAWNTSIVYEHAVGRALSLVLLALLLVPQLVAALAYLSLYFRLDDRTKKYRVLLVSGSILVVFASPLVGPALAQDAWPLISRFIGLAAAAVTLAAFVPPAWVRRRLGVESIDEQAPAGA